MLSPRHGLPKKLTHGDYTVALVCVLQFELDASQLLLDDKHVSLQAAPNDDNNYILGRMGRHNVVITSPGLSNYGTQSAAKMVTNMLRTFCNVRFVLNVGIGGGAPKAPHPDNPRCDLRLGDVVVSEPHSNHGGVLHYDMGKWDQKEEFVVKSYLNKPPELLLMAVKTLQSNYEFGKGNSKCHMNDYIERLRDIKNESSRPYRFPGRLEDRLFKADYKHEGGEDCSRCDVEMTVARLKRKSDFPVIHYGFIASANSVIKSAHHRDKLRDEQNVSCFDMEASGLIDFPCLVIRGISDYSNGHKNDLWRGYAALAAAAYAKDLLMAIQAKDIGETLPMIQVTDSISQLPCATGSSCKQSEVNDVYIGIMGVTGAGKSSFISMCSGKSVHIGHGLQSCTTDIEDVTFDYDKNTRVHLVDTPGFDDTNRSDSDVLHTLVDWLVSSFNDGKKLSGILFLHRITDPRLAGSARRNLGMFKKLCGENCYPAVLLITTMWDNVDKEIGFQREKELVDTREFWGMMTAKGSQVKRYLNTKESALALIGEILKLKENNKTDGKDGKDGTIVLNIQDEVAVKGREVAETAAALELNAEIARERQKYEKALRDMQVQMEKAIEEHDKDLQQAFMEEVNFLEEKIQKSKTEQENLKKSFKEIQEQKEREMHERLELMKIAYDQECKRVRKEGMEQIQQLEGQLKKQLSQKDTQAQERLEEAMEILKEEHRQNIQQLEIERGGEIQQLEEKIYQSETQTYEAAAKIRRFMEQQQYFDQEREYRMMSDKEAENKRLIEELQWERRTHLNDIRDLQRQRDSVTIFGAIKNKIRKVTL